MAMPAPDFGLCLFLIPERVVCSLFLPLAPVKLCEIMHFDIIQSPISTIRGGFIAGFSLFSGKNCDVINDIQMSGFLTFFFPELS